MRSRSTVLTLLAVAALAAAPASAAAQTGDPFSPLPPGRTEPPVVAPAPQEDEGLKAWQQTLLIVGGALFVVGIGVAIARDARRHAPDDTRRPPQAAEGFAGGPGAGASAGRARVAQRERQRARARARTARASRKKNR